MNKKNRTVGRPKGARKLGRADDIQIQALLSAGFTPDQIAAQMGRGRATIYNRIKATAAQPFLDLPQVQE